MARKKKKSPKGWVQPKLPFPPATPDPCPTCRNLPGSHLLCCPECGASGAG